MAFEAYLLRAFDYPHEKDQFRELVNRLNAQFGTSPGLHVLIGNVFFDGKELDAILFKGDGIYVIELKSHGGKIVFRENAPWLANGVEVKGGQHDGPFVQVRAYRSAVRTILVSKQERICPSRPDANWNFIGAVVVFANPIEFDPRDLVGNVRLWLCVTDLQRVAEVLAARPASRTGLEDTEIRNLLCELGIGQQRPYSDSMPDSSGPTELAEPPSPKPMGLAYLKAFSFREHDGRLRNEGGARAHASSIVQELFRDVREGLEPFKERRFRDDTRIRGVRIYPINEAVELVLIHSANVAYPAFIGEPERVDTWIERHRGLRLTVDTETNRMRVTLLSEGDASPPPSEPAPTVENIPYFERLPEFDLAEAVPQKLIRNALAALNEDSDSEDIKETLEAVGDQDLRSFLGDLLLLLQGGEIEQARARLRLREGAAVPVEDAGSLEEMAAESVENSDQLKLINTMSSEELDQLMDPAHFAEWMLFLHPDQKRLAEVVSERPVVLSGISGSGKTCILVHRARLMAQRYPGERIGIVTLSRNLSVLLNNLLNQLCTPEERASIEVVPFYEVFQRCLKEIGPDKYFQQLREELARYHESENTYMHKALNDVEERWPDSMVWDIDPVSHDDVEDEWDEFFMSQNEDLKSWMEAVEKLLVEYRIDASRYLEEEFTLIRSAFPIPSRFREYLEFKREGREIRFMKEYRKDILRVLLFWQEWLLTGGFIDHLGLTEALMPAHAEMRELPREFKFRCLLIDEYQDLSSLDLQLLRRVVNPSLPDSLFLAGDTVQKILVKKLVMRDAGLEQGPADHWRIRKNFRNSRQILRAASRLANHYGAMATSQGEELEVLDPELAQRETSPPIVVRTDDQVVKAWEIVLECMADDEFAPWTVCIATCAPKKISMADIVGKCPPSLTAKGLSGDCIFRPEDVVVGAYDELKGFEFRLVILLGCDEGSLPDAGVYADEAWRDALRLYVAMTRGRDQVFLLHSAQPSPFIKVMEEAVVAKTEFVEGTYAVPKPDSGPANNEAHNADASAPVARSIEIAATENCAHWFSEQAQTALHKYFAANHAHGQTNFSDWLTPHNLSRIDVNRLLRLRNIGRRAVLQIAQELQDHGISLVFPPGFRRRHNGNR